MQVLKSVVGVLWSFHAKVELVYANPRKKGFCKLCEVEIVEGQVCLIYGWFLELGRVLITGWFGELYQELIFTCNSELM